MVQVKELSKRYGDIHAVRSVNFTARSGEVVGFLGPNGAGKSTTMKMITGFVTPTSGDVIIDGMSVAEDPLHCKSQIGYMPENAPLYDDLTVYEFLEFIARMREIDDQNSAIQKVVELASLQQVLHQNIGTLSKGYRRRVSLAQSLIHDPHILILDEPTDGLDPNQKHEVRELIKSLAQKKCIIVSTHILEEVDAVCDRAIIIAKGEILYDGSPKELKEKSQTENINDVFRAYTTDSKVEGVQL